jgi:hypothetical protein
MPPNEMREPALSQEDRPAETQATAKQLDENSLTAAAADQRSPLRQALDVAIAEANGSKLSMKDLTVLSAQNDPFRLDTQANHRDGEWLAITARELGLGDRKIHLRGLHYMILGQPKPDGLPYTNTDADWLWLSGGCGKAARFLGYIPFDQIVDQRNAQPVVRLLEHLEPWPYVKVGINVEIPDADDLEPRIGAAYFTGVQPYKLVLVGEKSSLHDVLAPIAETFGADLYLPTGEISDTLIHQMAKIGVKDGRPMVVLYFSDCDTAGWQMPISVGRKLQAMQVSLFPELDFQVHRVALVPDQVREWGLPSTPLKDTERRGDAWQAATGVAQTEIDALASLRPELLQQLARDAIAPFYDRHLVTRVWDAYWEWQQRAQEVLDGALDQDHLAMLRTEATARLAELREQIDGINDALRIDVRGLDLPPIVVPQAELDGVHPMPLLDSSWPFAEQCRALIDSKAYRS